MSKLLHPPLSCIWKNPISLLLCSYAGTSSSPFGYQGSSSMTVHSTMDACQAASLFSEQLACQSSALAGLQPFSPSQQLAV